MCILMLQLPVMLLLAYGAYNFKARVLGTSLNCAFCITHLAGVLIGLNARFGAQGVLCATNVAPSSFSADKGFSDDTTYASDGALLGGLMMTQLAFWTVQCCLCHLPCHYTPVGNAALLLGARAKIDFLDSSSVIRET